MLALTRADDIARLTDTLLHVPEPAPIAAAGRRPVGVFLALGAGADEGRISCILAASERIVAMGGAPLRLAPTEVARLRPDVVLVDSASWRDNAGAACRAVVRRASAARLLMLGSVSIGDQALFDGLLAGVRGYVREEEGPVRLRRAVLRVAHGGLAFDLARREALYRRLVRELEESGLRPDLAGLTAVQRRVLDLIGAGLTNEEVGERLLVSTSTVQNYVWSLYSRLGIHSRADARLLALAQRLCPITRAGGPPASRGA